jgi:hypothetical protein
VFTADLVRVDLCHKPFTCQVTPVLAITIDSGAQEKRPLLQMAVWRGSSSFPFSSLVTDEPVLCVSRQLSITTGRVRLTVNFTLTFTLWTAFDQQRVSAAPGLTSELHQLAYKEGGLYSSNAIRS